MDCFALLDDCAATPAVPTSRLYTGFRRELRCEDPATLDAVCAALDAALGDGLHAVVVADYEWGARLLGAGARSGAVDVSLIWNDKNDLDLHVDCPNGRTLNFTNKVECGGILDIDRNAHANALTDQPVENIVWTSAPTCKGRCTVYVHFFRQHAGQPDSSPFTLRIKQGAKTQYVESSVGSGERRQVAAFDI